MYFWFLEEFEVVGLAKEFCGRCFSLWCCLGGLVRGNVKKIKGSYIERWKVVDIFCFVSFGLF